MTEKIVHKFWVHDPIPLHPHPRILVAFTIRPNNFLYFATATQHPCDIFDREFAHKTVTERLFDPNKRRKLSIATDSEDGLTLIDVMSKDELYREILLLEMHYTRHGTHKYIALYGATSGEVPALLISQACRNFKRSRSAQRAHKRVFKLYKLCN